ncbi:MAG: hypothetical protein ACYDBQ_01585 [Thermoplasmatota archaeon]
MPSMPEYATPTNTSNPILNPGFIWRITAFVLMAVALLGVILNAVGDGLQLSFGGTFLTFTWTHDVVHLVLAVAAFVFGFSSLPGNVVKVFAIVFGAVYLGLGIVGFFTMNPLGSSLSLALTPTLNIIHILLGGAYLTSGLAAKYT